MAFEKVTITCSKNDKQHQADVLSKSTKHIKVSLVGTDLTLDLYFKSINKVSGKNIFVGNSNGLEFVAEV